ncbi:hypothetical protein [Candidatus Allofournierella excrementigallinarum]|uniref:hypothetical protein n=1 Tax=Candidatus Allofournierella excrementigallinarum TaxID=2838592 RepID=UPI00374E85DE
MSQVLPLSFVPERTDARRGKNRRVGWSFAGSIASIPGGGARQKIFCEMNQKAQAILGGLTSIFGKYHGKFWRDTPPEALRRELCGVAF